jgi:hypothetical protein
MFNGRVPLERWSERHRLALTCVDELILSISLTRKPLMRLEVHGLRSHQPQCTADITKEQQRIFPDGYPNYVGILYRKYRRLERVLRPLFELLLHRADIKIFDFELHGIENPAYNCLNDKNGGLNNTIINTTTDGDKSKRLLIITIDRVQVRYDRVGRHIRLQLKKVRAFEGNNFVLKQQSEGVFSLSGCDVWIRLRRVFSLKQIEDGGGNDINMRRITRGLHDINISLFNGGRKGDKQDMALELSVQLSIEPRLHVDSDFASNLSINQLNGGGDGGESERLIKRVLRGMGLTTGISLIFGRFVTIAARQGSQLIRGYYTETVGVTREPIIIQFEW